jgi:hypothetical protein
MSREIYGGHPHDFTTIADRDDYVRRDAWVAEFWQRLAELFDGIEQESVDCATCGGYRVQVHREKPGATKMNVASAGVRSWRVGENGKLRPYFSGNVSVVNVTPRDAAPAVILLPLMGEVVGLNVRGEGWISGRVSERSDFHEVTLTDEGGKKWTVRYDAIERIRAPRSAGNLGVAKQRRGDL